MKNKRIPQKKDDEVRKNPMKNCKFPHEARNSLCKSEFPSHPVGGKLLSLQRAVITVLFKCEGFLVIE
jgi:hypothetical protein